MGANASDDLPEPERPVKTMSLSRGSSREMLRRLCSRAPRMVMVSAIGGKPTGVPQLEHVFRPCRAGPRSAGRAGVARHLEVGEVGVHQLGSRTGPTVE